VELLKLSVDVARTSKQLVAPNTPCFNALLDGLASKGLPDDAWDVFEMMQSLYVEGFPTKPSVASYSCVARAIGSESLPTTLERIDAITEQILDKYGEGALMPDRQVFDSIFMAYNSNWKAQDESANHAYDLLLRLEKLSESDPKLMPGLVSYRTVCQALSRSHLPGAMRKAEEMFARVNDLCGDQADHDTSYAMICSYVGNRNETSLEKAAAILEKMESSRSNGPGKSSATDTRVYNRLLFGYAKSKSPDKVQRVTHLFNQLEQAYPQGNKEGGPNIHSYNAMILAAARTSPFGSMSNFEVALTTFKELHSDPNKPNPNSVTYEYFVQACTRLLPAGDVRDKLIRQAFDLSRQKGFVTPYLVAQVHCLLPDVVDLLERAPHFNTMADKKLSRRKHPDYKLLPEEWCSSVPLKYRKRRVELKECNLIDLN